MKVFCILTLLIFFSLKAKADVNDFKKALSACYIRHSEQRDAEGDGLMALKFRQKSIDNLKAEDGLYPITPLSIDVNSVDELNLMLKFHRMLSYYRADFNILKNDYDTLSHLQCQFDIWMTENDQTKSSTEHKLSAKQNFIDNIKQFSQDYPILIGESDVSRNSASRDIEKSISNGYCISLIFEKDSYRIAENSSAMIESLLSKKQEFSPFGILLIGYINWYEEDHFAKLVAKKRMAAVYDFLTAIKINPYKIRGSLVDVRKRNSASDLGINSQVRVCMFDILKHGKLGNEFVKEFDFKNNMQYIDVRNEKIKR